MGWATVDTPMGPVSVAVTEDGVRAVRLSPVGSTVDRERHDRPDAQRSASDLLAEAVAQVRAYVAGERTDFDLPFALPQAVGSEFERAVWSELRRIPFGETRTYGQVAAAVRDPGAARAVGVACNRNPLPLLVPCHRVVGVGGKLVGFGAGLPAKRWLLEHEARLAMQRAWE